jgi:hypothetical protein
LPQLPSAFAPIVTSRRRLSVVRNFTSRRDHAAPPHQNATGPVGPILQRPAADPLATPRRKSAGNRPTSMIPSSAGP